MTEMQMERPLMVVENSRKRTKYLSLSFPFRTKKLTKLRSSGSTSQMRRDPVTVHQEGQELESQDEDFGKNLDELMD